MEFLPAKLLRFAGKRQLSQTVSICLSEGIIETRPLPYSYLPWTCPDVLWSCATAGHSVHMTIELDSCTARMRSLRGQCIYDLFLFIYGARLVFLILLGVVSLALGTIA